jgi:DoxX-like family
MFTAYVVVTLLAIAASTFVAVANFMRLKFVLVTAAKVGVPESWMTMLGILNAAGALGLLLGLIGVPLIGEAAAIGLILYFVGAIITHLRVRDYSIGPAAAFLLLAVAALVLGLVSS